MGKPDHMCWDAATSFTTLVVGTVLNVACAWWLHGTAAVPYVWAWQYALLMQIPEGVVWTHCSGHAAAAPSEYAADSRPCHPSLC